MNINLLKQVLIDQRAELFSPPTEDLPRHAEPELRKLINTSSLIKVVMGVRRSGKSTLCRASLDKSNLGYVNFDDERFVGLQTLDLDKIYNILQELTPNMTAMFFDEIQNIESWELFLNRLHRKKMNIIITGSNGKLLSQDLATHLTGRQVSVEIRPLVFKEFLSWRLENHTFAQNQNTSVQTSRIKNVFEQYFEMGGFPEVVLGEPLTYYLQELFDKIVTRDIVQRYKIREVKILKEIAIYLIQNSSQKTSFESLKNIFKLKSLATVQKYVEYLSNVFLIEELRGYSYKLTERSTSQRKTYACDLGMMKALWTKPTPDFGARLETLVFLELRSQKKEIYYLYENKKEVDFCVIENKKPRTLIQVCYDLVEGKTKDREISSLLEMAKKYQVQDLQIITLNEEDEITKDGYLIKVRPAYKFCLNLQNF